MSAVNSGAQTRNEAHFEASVGDIVTDDEARGAAPTDGRRARRERSRMAVIDAMFSLVQDGKVPPTAEDVAERAGVSVSSVFRNFDGLDDLQRHAVDRFQGRFAHLFVSSPVPGSDGPERVAHFVRTRLDLYEQAGPLLSLARQRAVDYQPMVEAVARNRALLAAQTRRCFAAEIAGRSPADAANLVSLIDSLTSPEAFDVMGKSHSRTRRQIAKAWTIGLESVLAGWPASAAATSTRSTNTHHLDTPGART